METLPPEPSPTPSDEELLNQLRILGSQEARLESKKSRVEQRLGSIAISEGFRAGMLYDVAEVVGERKVTDPHKPEPELARAPETVASRNTFGRAIKRFADRFSINGPRADEIEVSAEDRPDGNPSGFLDRHADIATARRIKKQQLRQARARHAEATFGAGLGLGKTARVRTLAERHSLKKEDKRLYKSGVISAEDLEQGRDEIKRERVDVPVKAVRREVRRERLGAMYSLARADQPIKSRIRKVRRKHAEATINKTQTKISNLQARRAEVEAKIRGSSQASSETTDISTSTTSEETGAADGSARATEKRRNFVRRLFGSAVRRTAKGAKFGIKVGVEAGKISLQETIDAHKRGEPINPDTVEALLREQGIAIGIEAFAKAGSKNTESELTERALRFLSDKLGEVRRSKNNDLLPPTDAK